MINKTTSLIMNYQKITASFIIIFMMTINLISALPSSFDNTLNELYDNLLQREYAGPISFPNHQVERKAQRSPSLRLRFGRSDPEMFESIEKRWFGDVHQKPIRSPSLRLRFGRRSDPLVQIHEFDNTDENYDRVRRDAGNQLKNEGLQDQDSVRVRRDVASDTTNEDKRAPSLRLRFGRDPNKMSAARALETSEFNSEILAGLLQALNDVEYNEMNSEDFIRESRKPAPLRLRWGRSVDTAPAHDTKHVDQINPSS